MTQLMGNFPPQAEPFESFNDPLERAMIVELVRALALGAPAPHALVFAGYTVTPRTLVFAKADAQVARLVRLELQRSYPNLNPEQISDKLHELKLEWALDFAYQAKHPSAVNVAVEALTKHREAQRTKGLTDTPKSPTVITLMPEKAPPSPPIVKNKQKDASLQ